MVGVVNHVAMYIGNDRVVHAANSKEGIKISKYITEIFTALEGLLIN